MENNITTSVTLGIPTYTFSGSSCTFEAPNNATYNLSLVDSGTILSVNYNATDSQDTSYIQSGSVSFDNSAGTQSIIYNQGDYILSSFSANVTGTKNIILGNETTVTVSSVSGNATYYIGNDSSLIVILSVSGTGEFCVGCNMSGFPEENGKLSLPDNQDGYVVTIYGDNSEVIANNATITVSSCTNAVIRGDNNTINVLIDSLNTVIIGDNNGIIADAGRNTQFISSVGTAPNSGKFGGITLNNNTISTGVSDLTITASNVLSSNFVASGNLTGVGLSVTGNADVTGTLTTGIVSCGTLSSSNNNNSVSVSTGAITTLGGLGVAKDIYLGGNIVLVSNATVDGVDVSSLASTVANLNTTLGLGNLTSNEVTQLGNINNVLISNSQWGYLGALNQGLATTNNVSFNQITCGNIQITGNTISAISGNIMMGDNVLLSGDPTNPLGAATKQYVDNMAQGIDYKESCLVMAASLTAYTSSGSGATKTLTATANGVLLIDGVTPDIGSRIFVNLNGSSGSVDNGIYTVTNVGSAGTQWVLTRSSDANTSVKVTSGMTTFIETGGTYSGRSYVLLTNNVVLDTSILIFTQLSGTGTGNSYTISNLSALGIGVYDSTTSNNFNMRSVYSTVPITVSLVNNDITIGLTQSGITHANISGLSADDHTQYLLLAGRTGGQIIFGGNSSGENLILRSTNNATKGQVIIDETTVSTSISTGALVVAGGVGISGATFIGDNILISGTTTSTGLATLSSGAKISNISPVSTVDNSVITGGASMSIYASSTAAIPTLTLQAKFGDITVGNINITTTTASTSTSTGALVIAGGVGIGGSLFVNTGTIATINCTTFTSSGSVTTPIINGVTNSLTIRANVSGTGTITIPSVVNFTSNTTSSSTTTGSIVVTGGVGVSGATFIGGTVSVTGATTLSSTLAVTTSVSCPSFITSGSSMTITGGTAAAGMSIRGSSAASGQLTITSTTSATKATAGIRMTESIASTSTSTGTLVITGGLGVAGAIFAGSISTAGTVALGTTTVTGTLTASNVTTAGTLTLTGTSITTNNPVIFNSTCSVTGVLSSGTSIISPIVAGSNTTLGGLTIRGNTADTTGTITMASAVVLTIGTASTSTGTGSLVVTGGVGVSGNVFIGGNGSFSGTLTVTGTSNMSGIACESISASGNTLTITGGNVVSGMTITGSSAASGQMTLASTTSVTKATAGILMPETIASTSTSTGSLVVSGGVGIGGALYAGSINTSGSGVFGNITINNSTLSGTSGLTIAAGGTITTANNVSLTSVSNTSLTLAGGMSIAGNASVSGNVIVAGNTISPILSGSTLSSGNLTIRANTIDTTGTITIPSETSITNNTASTSTSTGALLVAGGVGISGSVFIGGNGSIAGNMAVTGNLTVSGIMSIGTFSATNMTVNNITGITGTTMVVTGSNIISGMTITGSSAASGQMTLISTTSATKATAGILMPETIASTSTSTGTLVVSGGVGIGGTMYANGINTSNGTITTLTVSGTANISDATITTLSSTGATVGTLTMTGTVSGVNIIMSGNVSAATVTGTTSISTPLITRTGTLTLTGTTGVTTGSQMSVTNTTASTSTSTGAFTVAGGVGIGGSLYIGNLSLSGTTIASSTTLSVTAGVVSFSGTISATSMTATSATTSTSPSTGAFIVSGGVGIGDNSTFAKNISVGSSGTVNYNSGVGMLHCADITTEPSSVPTNGKYNYSIDQRLLSYGTSYTIHDESGVTVRVKTVTSLPANTANGTTIVASANGVLPAIDGITLVVGDYVFIDANSGVTNTSYGIYKITSIGSACTTWIMTRATCANTPAKFKRGTKIIITDGATMGGTIWIHNTNSSTGASFTFSTILTFIQASGSASVAGATNVGTGTGVYSSINGSTLQFNSIKAGTGTTVALVANDVVISSNDTAIVHNNLSGLTNGDPHTQYIILTGRAGGQSLIGGSVGGENLTLQSNATSASTGGVIINSELRINSGIITGTSGGNLVLTGGTASGNQLILRSTSNATKGYVIVDETTTSTSPTTGALVVTGGVGISDNVSIAKNIHIGNGTANYNSGIGIISIDNVSTEPSTADTSGTLMYSVKNKLVANLQALDISHIYVHGKPVTALPANTANGITIVANSNGTLPAIDGITMTVGKLVLIDLDSGVTPSTAYGIYEITSIGSAGSTWTMTRSTLCNSSEKMRRGLKILVTDGLTNAGEEYIHLTNSDTGAEFTMNTNVPVFYNCRGLFLFNAGPVTSTAAATTFTTNFLFNAVSTPILPAGRYKIHYAFSSRSTSASVAYAIRINIDSTTVTGAAATGLTMPRAISTTVPQMHSGVGYITFTTNASHTITWGVNGGGQTATYTDASIHLTLV